MPQGALTGVGDSVPGAQAAQKTGETRPLHSPGPCQPQQALPKPVTITQENSGLEGHACGYVLLHRGASGVRGLGEQAQPPKPQFPALSAAGGHVHGENLAVSGHMSDSSLLQWTILGCLGCSSKVRAMFLCHTPSDHSLPPCHWRWAPNL